MLPFALLALLAGPTDLSPGTTYDPAIPTIKKTLGYDHGEEITTGEGFVTYLKALEGASSGRAKVIEYARSWEGRPLVVMIVGTAERIASLDSIKADMKKLADPRGISASDLEAVINRAPVITWLIHGVHGNEISSGDAAIAEAYHLLAANNDLEGEASRVALACAVWGPLIVGESARYDRTFSFGREDRDAGPRPQRLGARLDQAHEGQE